MSLPTQHDVQELAKHTGDAAFFGGGLYVLATKALPIVTLVATAVWAVFRIWDIWLSVKQRRLALEAQKKALKDAGG